VRGVQRQVDVLARRAAISTNDWPLTGDGFSKYAPLLGGTNSPPMKLPYRLFHRYEAGPEPRKLP
jgi:hypothetical protein